MQALSHHHCWRLQHFSLGWHRTTLLHRGLQQAATSKPGALLSTVKGKGWAEAPMKEAAEPSSAIPRKNAYEMLEHLKNFALPLTLVLGTSALLSKFVHRVCDKVHDNCSMVVKCICNCVGK